MLRLHLLKPVTLEVQWRLGFKMHNRFGSQPEVLESLTANTV